MERIDAREVDAARFWRPIEDIQRGSTQPEHILRLALALLFFHFILDHPKAGRTAGVSLSLLGDFRDLKNRRPDDSVSHLLDTIIQELSRSLGSRSMSEGIANIPPNEIHRLIAVTDHPPVRDSHMPYLFDYGLAKLYRLTTHGESKAIEFVAALTLGLAASVGTVLEAVSPTAELGVRLTERGLLRQYKLSEPPAPMAFEVKMRLAIYGLPPNDSPSNATFRPSDLADFSLFTPPSYGAKRRVHGYGKLGGIDLDGHGLEMAIQFTGSAQRGQSAAFLVPAGDLRARGWKDRIRAELVRSGMLSAVIDIPKPALSGKQRWSLFLLRRPLSDAGYGTLFVLGQALDTLERESPQRLGTFLGFLLTTFLRERPKIWSDSQVFSELGELLGPRAERMFGRQYADHAGLCIAIDHIHSRDSFTSLSPVDYVPADLGSGWQAPLDALPFQNLLETGIVGRCIYVIGNNGEGKSFLLRELVNPFLRNRRNVFAFAFGTTDRFFTKPGSAIGDGKYTYLGSRTGSRGVGAKALACQAAQYMSQIYAQPDRQKAFNEVLAVIGFDAQQYLLPKDDSPQFLEQIIRLDSDTNTWMGDTKGKRLGVKRGKDDIVPLDELSSGEQQVLLLCIKMIAHATSSALFLVDEPETSLHVSWQQALPKVFALIAERFELDIVIATHSPVMLSAARGATDLCFVARAGALAPVTSTEMRSIETALFEGFRIYTENNREVHERCAELVSSSIALVNGAAIPQSTESIEIELRDMETVVRTATQKLRSAAVTRDLELIRRAREAVAEMTRMAERAYGQDDEGSR